MRSKTFDNAMWTLNEIVSACREGNPVVVTMPTPQIELLAEYLFVQVIPGTVEQDNGRILFIVVPTAKGKTQLKACRRAWLEEIEQCLGT